MNRTRDRHILATTTHSIDGRSAGYENALRQARQIAVREMENEARELGANAVIAVDYETAGERGSMLMVSASGTAVILE